MKIEANDKEVQDIFSLGYFKIPRFQRPYSWEAEEVDSFWTDAVKENPENYFIGSMVVYQNRKPYFGVVDGQQRLTTITLILAALRNAFLRIEEKNLAIGIHKYIEKANIDNDDEFILNAETSFPYLQNHIQSFDGFNIRCDVGHEELKLKRAYDLITSRLYQEVPELKTLESKDPQGKLFQEDDIVVKKIKHIRDKVLALKLVFIQLENEDDAYLIFETLNARGRDLTTPDLVKNLLLKKLQSRSISIDKAKESWSRVVKKFDDITDSDVLDTFLLHFWISKFDYTSDKKLFSFVKNHIEVKGYQADKLISELSSSAELYVKIIRPESALWRNEEAEVRNHLIALRIFKVKQPLPFVLSLLRSYEDNLISLKNLKSSLQKVVDFHFCFNAITSQRSSGSIATSYSKLAISLSNINDKNEFQNIDNDLTRFIRRKMPEIDEFIVKFAELQYLDNMTKYKNLIRYSLNRLLPNGKNGITIDYGSLTIEHIAPQSYIGSEFNESSVASIGNLILTDSKLNTEVLKDNHPITKLMKLKEINYPLADVLIPQTAHWSKQEIQERVKSMATYLYNSLHY
ncbi:DUF262 domain-containing HNH endonuclease family protein [Shewanella sp. 1CM18E]|uniref:DUF262 domain-containing protein n=1 Tax=Shewanella sp. 1CM18E TaxID=2929169 RepID=UPI0020C131DF|nr:DUF262 domain-containing protein [Shewanella sp. 1CM18E]MCK8044558.1 DUF262 domain-containing HNH endonuclease family protein [Shewanella sp. 1CM18E]